MQNLKKAICYLFSLVYGVLAAYWFPVALLIAFNFTKGIANNPDGEIAIPFGILLGLFLLAGAVIFCICIIRAKLLRNAEKWICLALFALSIMVGTFFVLYVWEEFFYCLTWHINH